MVQYRIEWIRLFNNYKSNGDWHEYKDKEFLEECIKNYNKEYNGKIRHWLGTNSD